jgi:hypothetical protein
MSGEALPEFLLSLEQNLSDGPEIRAVDTPNNFIPDLYFGVPENERFLGYWDQVEGRLYNLRHNLTIDGAPQNLPLFQPPLDPRQLAQAVAAAGAGAVLGAAPAPIPHYRFRHMIEKAKEAASTVIQFGATLLSALEKGDAEQLDALRATHESALLGLSRTMKESQLRSAQAAVESLNRGLEAIKFRVSYYSQLLETGGLTALPNDTAQEKEQTQIDLELAAISTHLISAGLRGGAVVAHLIPTVFGLADGCFQPGSAFSEGANISDSIGSMLSQSAGIAGTLAQYIRRAEDWLLQRETALKDVEQAAAQLEAAQFQVEIAKAELDLLEKSIAQAAEIESFMKSRFTNQELYQWMVGGLASVYFQSYQLAHGLALSAESAWKFEQDETQTFIQTGYWDDLRKGLLAGEALLLDIHRMEKMCLDNNRRRLEIVKTISLKKLLKDDVFNNKKKTGVFVFEFGKADFDQDYPGHYCRKIHSLLVSLPALLGPYQNVHATLTQTANEIDVDGRGATRKDFRVSQTIALSQGVNESGVFEMSFYDERYLPFEGTGAVSSWKLDIPDSANPGLLENLNDVIIELRYTALQNG